MRKLSRNHACLTTFLKNNNLRLKNCEIIKKISEKSCTQKNML